MIGRRAKEAGMSFSRFMIVCALHGADADDGEEGPRLVLSEDEQRILYERVALLDRCNEALLSRLPGTEISALGALGLPGAGGAIPDRRRERGRFMRRRGRSLPRAYSLSCTDSEWGSVRVLAERKGLSISRYMVECGLTVDPEAEPAPPPRLVLDEAEQRALHDRVIAIAERTVPAGADDAVMTRVRNSPRLPGRREDADHDARRPRGGAAGDSGGPRRRGRSGGNCRPPPHAHGRAQGAREFGLGMIGGRPAVD